MKINGNDIKEIIVTTKEGELVVTITDENIISHEDYVVALREDNLLS